MPKCIIIIIVVVKPVLPVKQTFDQCASWQHLVETLLTPGTEGRIHRLSANQKIPFCFH